jgi:hypothetical protein
MIMGREKRECVTCSYKIKCDALEFKLSQPFTSGQVVINKYHRHEEVMIFCCVRPGAPKYAIVIRGDGRLSDMPIDVLVKHTKE